MTKQRRQWLRLGKALLGCIAVIACGSRLNMMGYDAGLTSEPATGGETSTNGVDENMACTGGGPAWFPDEATGGTSSGGSDAFLGSGGQVNVGTAASTGLGVPRTDPRPYACTANTAAYYDGPPSDAGGCPDIYNSSRSYPVGTKRTIVAPTSTGGVTCSAWDCVCETTGCWGPRASNLCWGVCSGN